MIRCPARLPLYALLAVLPVVEGVLQVRRGPAPVPEASFLPEARYLYAESRAPFFVRKGGSWAAARPRALPAEFSVVKSTEELRIFLVGESVARRLGAEAVREAFQASFPNKEALAVDAGMGTYASAQWSEVAAEAASKSPDFLVIMAGHNEDLRPDALSLPLLRLNLALRRLWLWRWAQDSLPRRRPGRAAQEARFESRLRQSARRAKTASARAVLCTLPVNADWPAPGKGEPPDASTPERNEAVRRIAREEGAALADLEELFARRARGGRPGWESFGDGVHFRPALDRLVARAVARAAAGGSALDPDLVAAPAAPPWKAGPELDAVAWAGFFDALQAERRAPGSSDPRALARLELVARVDDRTLTRLLDGPGPLSAAFSSSPWTAVLAPDVAAHLPALRAQADEARRRARAGRGPRPGKLL